MKINPAVIKTIIFSSPLIPLIVFVEMIYHPAWRKIYDVWAPAIISTLLVFLVVAMLAHMIFGQKTGGR